MWVQSGLSIALSRIPWSPSKKELTNTECFQRWKARAKVEIGGISNTTFWCGTQFYDARACEKKGIHLQRRVKEIRMTDCLVSLFYLRDEKWESMFLLEAINISWRARYFLWLFLLSPLCRKLAISASCGYNQLGMGEFWTWSSGMIKSSDNVLRRKWHHFWLCKGEWWKKLRRLGPSKQLEKSFHMMTI